MTTWGAMPWPWYEAYERGRPGYPVAAVSLVEDVPVPATVLDLAAGTGKLTRLLVPRFERVLAVEPDADMRRMLATTCPEARLLAGTASRLPVADRSVDVVFAAQAFHWFDDETALAEIARVLHPQGTFVALWNVATGPPHPPIPAVTEALAPCWPKGMPFPLDLSLGSWTPRVWQLASTRSLFEEHRETALPNPQTVDPDGFVDFLGSMGWIAELPDGERAALFEDVRARLTAPHYVLPWQTRVHWARRR